MQPHGARRKVNKPAILPQIRRLVEESGLSYTEVASLAKVEYQNLRRFMLGVTEKFNIIEAELVFYALTGRTFSAPNVPLKKSLLRRRKEAA